MSVALVISAFAGGIVAAEVCYVARGALDVRRDIRRLRKRMRDRRTLDYSALNYPASGIETEGQDGETRIGAKHESPTAAPSGGDAQPQPQSSPTARTA